jgi:hypothetical protein
MQGYAVIMFINVSEKRNLVSVAKHGYSAKVSIKKNAIRLIRGNIKYAFNPPKIHFLCQGLRNRNVFFSRTELGKHNASPSAELLA